MNKEKVYILQKDLPDGSKNGDEYSLRKNGRDRYTNHRYRHSESPVIEDAAWFTWQVEDNEKFFKLKEEVKPVVVGSEFWINRIRFVFGEGFPEISISKERLAEILIAEQKGMLNIIQPISSEDVKEYSKKEYLKFGEDCWKAARLKERILYNPNLQQQQNWSLQNQQQNGSYQAVDKYKTFKGYIDTI